MSDAEAAADAADDDDAEGGGSDPSITIYDYPSCVEPKDGEPSCLQNCPDGSGLQCQIFARTYRLDVEGGTRCFRALNTCQGCLDMPLQEANALEEVNCAEATYSLIASDTKCPYQHEDRLEKLTDQSLQQCAAACKSNPQCSHFSFGTPQTKRKNIGDCMLCQVRAWHEAWPLVRVGVNDPFDGHRRTAPPHSHRFAARHRTPHRIGTATHTTTTQRTAVPHSTAPHTAPPSDACDTADTPGCFVTPPLPPRARRRRSLRRATTASMRTS